nr:DUF1016 N-terminal domain-containing protein [Pseudogulbenkiania sp. MAI-1]
MTARSVSLTPPPAGYADWLAELKTRIHSAQQRAALAVNREMVLLYWQIGCDILERQAREGWGAKVIERLAHDLRSAFPEMKGFSRANLMHMRAFAEVWPEGEIVQQAVGQLPWGNSPPSCRPACPASSRSNGSWAHCRTPRQRRKTDGLGTRRRRKALRRQVAGAGSCAVRQYQWLCRLEMLWWPNAVAAACRCL